MATIKHGPIFYGKLALGVVGQLLLPLFGAFVFVLLMAVMISPVFVVGGFARNDAAVAILGCILFVILAWAVRRGIAGYSALTFGLALAGIGTFASDARYIPPVIVLYAPLFWMCQRKRARLTPWENAKSDIDRRDYEKAIPKLEKLAGEGDLRAQRSLGVIHRNGDGTPIDYGQATAWYQLAADQGDGAARLNLALMYKSGEGVKKSLAIAYVWYRLAADVHAGGAEERADAIAEAMTQEELSEARDVLSHYRRTQK